jgi:glyoxylase-like metal-dependent hydrolase (beta-lactamase superfamily II)
VKPEVAAFFDPETNTVSYVVKDPGSDACAIIDAVMDIDYAAGQYPRPRRRDRGRIRRHAQGARYPKVPVNQL